MPRGAAEKPTFASPNPGNDAPLWAGGASPPTRLSPVCSADAMKRSWSRWCGPWFPGGPPSLAGKRPWPSMRRGLTPGARSPFLVTRAKDREPGVPWRPWRPWTMALAVDRRLILAQTARRGPPPDGATWRPLVAMAHQHGPLGLVLAAAEVDRERHPQPIRHVVLAQRGMPAKRGGATWHSQGLRAPMRQAFPGHLYRQRARIERVMSAVKRKRSARAPGRSLARPCLQALRLGMASNIYRL